MQTGASVDWYRLYVFNSPYNSDGQKTSHVPLQTVCAHFVFIHVGTALKKHNTLNQIFKAANAVAKLQMKS
jgi:cytochrome b561